MANKEHVELIRQGVEVWNKWRKDNPRVRPDLSEADLNGAMLTGAELSGANLTGASLWRANLIEADLSGADLSRADLRGAGLSEGDLSEANLAQADLTQTILSEADLRGANLTLVNFTIALFGKTNFTEARLAFTIFQSVDLSASIGLETCVHGAPSSIDHQTLEQSGELPLKFLQGCGLPDWLIDAAEANIHGAIRFYSCFISYNNKDEGFANRLHADLQDSGVRCWFAPEDMKIGDKIRHAIDSAIRLRDKLLVILSETSVNSQWVETEVETALAEERDRKETVLFPIRVDDAVMECKTPWARQLKDTRHIGDFTGWKNHDSYTKAFERLLRDLKESK